MHPQPSVHCSAGLLVDALRFRRAKGGSIRGSRVAAGVPSASSPRLSLIPTSFRLARSSKAAAFDLSGGLFAFVPRTLAPSSVSGPAALYCRTGLLNSARYGRCTLVELASWRCAC